MQLGEHFLFGTHGIHLPTNSAEFYLWAFLLIVFHIVLASAAKLVKGKYEYDIGTVVYDAATFSGSVLLLIGVLIDPHVLKLIGDTTWFLIIAGTFGVIYSILALFRH